MPLDGTDIRDERGGGICGRCCGARSFVGLLGAVGGVLHRGGVAVVAEGRERRAAGKCRVAADRVGAAGAGHRRGLSRERGGASCESHAAVELFRYRGEQLFP